MTRDFSDGSEHDEDYRTDGPMTDEELAEEARYAFHIAAMRRKLNGPPEGPEAA